MPPKATLLAIALLGLAPAPSFATIHTVRQDGTGDFVSIHDAVAAADSGDTVEVGPGTYPESVTLDIAITITSTDGSAATIIQNAPTWVINAGPSRIEGLSIRNMEDRGLWINGALVTISDCEIYGNSPPCQSYYESLWCEPGGGAYAENGAVVDFNRCRFENNFGIDGGAAAVVTGSHVTLRQCSIVANEGLDGCAGVYVSNATLDVIGCLFAGNTNWASEVRELDGVGALEYVSSTGSITGSTFYNNLLSIVILKDSQTVPIERCIFFDDSRYVPSVAYSPSDDPGPRTCNVYFGARIWGDELKADERVINPLLCDPKGGDFSISTTSAAAPQNSPCGQLIGAFGTGCTLDKDPLIITVRKDGSGDFTTVTPAVRKAVSDEITVDIGPGVFNEGSSAVVDYGITIRSTYGADQTIIKGFELTVRAVGKTVTIEGLTMREAPGPAIHVARGEVRATDCIFQNNAAGTDGGSAVSAWGSNSSIRITNCRFIDNGMPDSPDPGGALFAESYAQGYVRGCHFEGNAGQYAVATTSGILDVDSCLFVGNKARNAAVSFHLASGSVTRSTFYANIDSIYGTVLIDYSPDVTIDRNIFAGDDGAAVYYITPAGPRSCNVYWDNDGGAVVGDTLSVDEVEADPLFCDPASGDFTLSGGSPAAPQSGVCSYLAGAFPVGCNPVPVTVMFWSSSVEGGVGLIWDISSALSLAGCWASRERTVDGQITRVPETGLLDHTAGGWLDTTTTLGQSYRYTLFVVDDQGTDYPSPHMTSVTDGYLHIDHFAATRMASGIELEWDTDASEAMAGYYLDREEVVGGDRIRIPEQGLFGPAANSAVDQDVMMDTEYRYSLFVVDGRQAEHQSEPVSITSAPLWIDNFEATVTLDRVELAWETTTSLDLLWCFLTREDLTIGGTERLPEGGFFDGTAGAYVDDGVVANRRYQYTLVVVLSASEELSAGPAEANVGYLTVHGFTATDVPGGVELVWEITASDSLSGCYLDRYDPADDQTIRLPGQGLVDADQGRFVDKQTSQGKQYRYRLIVVDWRGGEHPGPSTQLTTATYKTDLSQNRPNPFNPGTTIPYSLEEQTQVTLIVFDVLGRRVRTLVDQTQPAGAYRQPWDGSNDAGQPVASGVYWYRLKAGDYEATRKMTLLR